MFLLVPCGMGFLEDVELCQAPQLVGVRVAAVQQVEGLRAGQSVSHTQCRPDHLIHR
jgi:hypothetical protein